MQTSDCSPYRSAAARDACFAYLDSRAAREWPVPSQTETVPTTYGPTFVRISGPADAPPLILLPGAATPSLMWAPNIAALSGAYRTYAVDQIGDFGRSLCTRHLRTFGDILDWLNDVLAGLHLDHGVNLTGISYGGAVAAEYALHFPAKLERLVLLAPGGIVLRLRVEFIARLTLAVLARRRGLASVIRWMFADAERKDPAWVNAVLEQLSLNMRSLERRTLPNPRVWTAQDWTHLRVPTLFLVGEHETIYSAEKAVNRLKVVAPHVTSAIVPDAGHDLLFAQADLVDRMILEFLKQQPAVSTTSRAVAH